MSALTTDTDQWMTPGALAAVTLQSVIFFQDAAGRLQATTVPTDALGHLAGLLQVPEGIWSSLYSRVYGQGVASSVVFNSALTTGLRTILTPAHLTVYS